VSGFLSRLERHGENVTINSRVVRDRLQRSRAEPSRLEFVVAYRCHGFAGSTPLSTVGARMAKASRKQRARAAGPTSNETQSQTGKVTFGVDENFKVYGHHGKGNRVPLSDEPVTGNLNLTSEQLAMLHGLPERPPSSQLIQAPSQWMKQRDDQRERRQQDQQDQLDATLKAVAVAVADAIASRVDPPKKKRAKQSRQAEKSKAEQRREDAERGDEWLRGRNSGQYLTYKDMAETQRIEWWDLRASLDRDRHHRADVWSAMKKPRRKKSVKSV
jgi:hypothetical protein